MNSTIKIIQLWHNHQLIWQLVKREITSRYRGSIMGLAWSFVTPLLMLGVYTFVFSVVFKARWNAGGDESRIDFGITLFAGMIVFNILAEVVNRAPGLIIANVNFVKKVLFPLEILPIVSLGSALFNGLVSLLALLIVQLIIKHTMPWTIVILPLVILPLIFAALGLGWFLSATGVYVRDIGQLTNVLTTVLMFLSAVFYPLKALPEIYQPILKLNPMALIITESRNVLIYGELPDWRVLSITTILGLLMSITGFWWFQKTRKGFADVI